MYPRKRAYNTSYLFMVLLFITACNSNKANNVENVLHENYIEPTPVNDFEITEITGQFEQEEKAEGAILNVLIKLKNNTSNTINNVEIISAVKTQYKNESNITYYPDPNYEYPSDSEYLAGPTTMQYGGINNYRAKEKWLPGQTKSFNLKVFYTYGFAWTVRGFENSIFERTPNKVEFIAAYKFIGLDGEYKDELKVEILDLWKEYQTQLGLR